MNYKQYAEKKRILHIKLSLLINSVDKYKNKTDYDFRINSFYYNKLIKKCDVLVIEILKYDESYTQ